MASSATIDVSVRGAGIFGLSVAWACVQAGARVELVDPAGVAAGASGGLVGALAPHVPENWNAKKQFQLESLLMAEAFWSEVAEVSGCDPGYARAGRVQPLAPDAVDLAQSRADGARHHWGDVARWEVTSDPGGWDVPSPSGLYVHDTLSAHLHPQMACFALAAALRAHGVPVSTEPAGTAGAVVWATGVAGLAALNADHTRMVGTGIKGQAALLPLDKPGAPQVFADTLHIIPHTNGTVAIGSTTEREFTAPDITDGLLDDVLARARAAVPELRAAPVVSRWAGLRPRSRSRAPMLGPWPDRAGHFIANGGFKIGFGMAPKVGDVMATLLLENRNTIPEGFDVAASL